MTRLTWKPKMHVPRLRHRSPTNQTLRRQLPTAASGYGRIEYDTRWFVMQRDGGVCRHCRAAGDLQFDHIVPRSRGGSGSAANVELLCGACNRKKAAGLQP